jgi:hypothetical protein
LLLLLLLSEFKNEAPSFITIDVFNRRINRVPLIKLNKLAIRIS